MVSNAERISFLSNFIFCFLITSYNLLLRLNTDCKDSLKIVKWEMGNGKSFVDLIITICNCLLPVLTDH